jgi:hypothetical protein
MAEMPEVNASNLLEVRRKYFDACVHIFSLLVI